VRKAKRLADPKLIALSVAACFSLSSGQSGANPVGGAVSSGSASFAASGNTLTVTNSASAIINWQSFSIGVNEITRFVQSSGASAVLNRVTGAGGVIPQSVIDGVLSSNGRVFLLNSSGIAIGANARIDVAGFVASSLNLSDADFAAGRMRFTATPGAGAVTNAGVIDTSSAGPGGRVFLVGSDVQNSGLIRTPQGQIVLAAGKSVELVSENSPFVTVNIVADSEQALNVGQLLADAGRIGMFGALVRQSGVAQANSAVVGDNGEIRLVATKDLTLDAGSLTTANGPSGGKVTLQAQGGTNLIYGTVEAKGASGQGGTIEALGVRVGVLGNGIIDASGDTGGGTVLVGGDQHGANANVQNAQQTLIGPDGIIRADAATTGDGGRVIVWSDAYTQIYGSVSARGGAQSGNGGFIETSSAGGMDLTGVRIDARAPNGQGGTWLLDPLDVVIEPNSYGGGDPIANALTFAANPGNVTHVTEQTIETNFTNVGNTSIQATRDVLFNANLNLVYATVTPQQTFEVRAVRNIDMAADGVAHSITTNGQNVTLSANDNGIPTSPPGLNTASGTGSILGGGSVTTNGGNVSLSGYGITIGAVNTVANSNPNLVPSGNVNMLSYGADIVTGSIATNAVPNPLVSSPGGSVTLTTFSGNIQVNGTIDSRGANGFNARSSAQGSNGGAVILARGSQAAPGKITVTGDILTSGGDGLATTATINGQPNGGAGGYISIGANNAGGIPGQTSPVYGDVSVLGNMISHGGNGATSPAGVAGGSGGGGGVILINTSGNVQVGSSAQRVADASGGKGGAGSAATSTTAGTSAGNGGLGGVISVYGGTVVVASGLISYGGAGGIGGLGSAVVGYGGGVGGLGGDGGSVILNGTGALAAGSINTAGGDGGAGGTASGAAAPGSGGGGAAGGAVSLASTGSYVSVGAIVTTSGNDGDAGGTGAGTSFVNSGGGVTISAATTISAGDITTSGGNGGNSGTTSVLALGGDGGAVNMNATGNIKTGAITTTGGAGATGTAAGAAYAGNAGTAGTIILGSNGSVTTGAIDASGGHSAPVSIGALNSITTGSITARALTPVSGGATVQLNGGNGPIAVSGNIDVRGSGGTTILIDTNGDGGISSLLGGSNAGSVTISRTGTSNVPIQVGSILASGGSGIGSQSGNGGLGGSVTVISGTTPALAYGSVSVGSIDVHGGSAAPGSIGAGGVGANGGSVLMYGSSVSAGAIDASGGAGGTGAADIGNGGLAGGYGGNGGRVNLQSVGDVAVGNISVGGGRGGDGGKGSGILAGVGGNGGAGGNIIVASTGYGSIDMTNGGGTIVSAGGNGGTGGAGDPVKGGNGGNGGIGGNVTVSAPYGSISVLSPLVIDSVTFNPGAAPAGSLMVLNGGLGGAGGADFGLGAGTPGLPGTGAGTFTVAGTIVLVNPSLGLDGQAVIQGTNQLLNGNNAPSSDDLQKKQEDSKKRNQVAACK
jgi:filamentous hemagglutinin family protein